MARVVIGSILIVAWKQNGAVLRTYIVLANRLGDKNRVRLQVVPYVGEFMVPGIIIPLSEETYRVRSEQMVRPSNVLLWRTFVTVSGCRQRSTWVSQSSRSPQNMK